MPRERTNALAGTKTSSPRCTPPGDFTRDHGLAAGLLACRSVLAAAFPGAKAPSGIVAENSLLTVAGAAVALHVNVRTTFPFDPLREPPRLHDEITAKLCQAAIGFLSTKRLAVAAVSQKKKGLPAFFGSLRARTSTRLAKISFPIGRSFPFPTC